MLFFSYPILNFLYLLAAATSVKVQQNSKQSHYFILLLECNYHLVLCCWEVLFFCVSKQKVQQFSECKREGNGQKQLNCCNNIVSGQELLAWLQILWQGKITEWPVGRGVCLFSICCKQQKAREVFGMRTPSKHSLHLLMTLVKPFQLVFWEA